MLVEHISAERETASANAAVFLVAALRQSLAQGDEGVLVVSGGTTPGRCFEHLSAATLDWSRVTVLLSDERYVAPDHADSNERLVRGSLLTGPASAARLLGVYQDDLTVDEACDAIAGRMPPVNPSCALLGMGSDGHFASLFPDADRLQEGLRATGTVPYIPIRTSASPHARVSMTLAYLLRSASIALLCFGDDKRAVLDAAKQGADLPITRLLEAARTDVHLFWAP